MEILTLTAPETPPAPTVTDVRVARLDLDFEEAHIVIHLRTNTGTREEYTYDGAEATALMIQLNKANLSTKSLHRRILEKLVADGKRTGAISGAPD